MASWTPLYEGQPPPKCAVPGKSVEEPGIWVGSELGVSFHCRCGWVSERRPTPAEVRTLLLAHLGAGGDGRSDDDNG
jgi:hypothetical protein